MVMPFESRVVPNLNRLPIMTQPSSITRSRHSLSYALAIGSDRLPRRGMRTCLRKSPHNLIVWCTPVDPSADFCDRAGIELRPILRHVFKSRSEVDRRHEAPVERDGANHIVR